MTPEQESVLYFTWKPQYKPSSLCFKERGGNSAVVVYRKDDGNRLPSNLHRIYDAWMDGKQLTNAEMEWKIGQVVKF